MKRRVLVVDDEQIMRETHKEVLEFLGIDEVLTASNGLFALSMIEAYQESLGLITLDMDMPEMDGITFMQELQRRAESNPRLLEIPIVVISGGWSTVQLGMLRALGVKELFLKPIELTTWDAILDLYARKSLSEGQEMALTGKEV